MRRFLHCVGAIRCPAPRALYGRRARGDRRRQHGRVDGIIELKEVEELQLDARKVELHVTPLGRDVHHHHLFHLLLQRLWRVWLIIGVGVAIGDVAQGHQVTGAGREELRASSLARGSRRHESVGAREAQSAIGHFGRPHPTPPHPGGQDF
jgi:hypothetical protein